jgi:hypothetical protein
MTSSQLFRIMTAAFIAGPIAGLLAAAVFHFLRFLAGPGEMEFVASGSQLGFGRAAGGGGGSGLAETTGPDLLHRAQDMILEALRGGPPEGMTNVELGDATNLNPPIHEGRRGEVTRTILTYLVEQGLVEKDGQRYRLAE